mgnify:CR=1 FL=1
MENFKFRYQSQNKTQSFLLKIFPKNNFYFSFFLTFKCVTFSKINNLGNFFKNVLRLVSAILGGR